MKRTTLLISFLVVALVATNALWAYRTLDLGVTLTYQGASLEENQQALSQALAIIKASGNPNVNRSQIVEAAKRAWPSSEPFEKEGYLWVGRLGLRFNNNGRLVEAVSGF
jgi:hypothetical protein